MRKFLQTTKTLFKDDNFLRALGGIEGFVSKTLSIAMVLVILVSVFDLVIFLFRDFLIPELRTPDIGTFSANLFKIFGLFLNVLIALEILENITAYLKKHVIQVELVIITSLIAVARKIIILDFTKTGAAELAALALAILALSGSYWLVKKIHHRPKDS